MMWLTWRQFRAQAIAAAAGLGIVAVTLAITGVGVISQYNADGLGTCHSSCATQATRFLDEVRNGPDHPLFYGGLFLMYLVPALIGIFWGAPLIARELETGSHRLAWNQSISRTRWTAMKLGLIGLAAVATAGLLSLVISWWASPIDSAMNFGAADTGSGFPRISPLVFGARGVVPLGYAAFAFALGVTAGVLIRRTLPAMAITLAVFAAVAIMVPIFVRPHLISPVHVTAPFNAYRNNELSISSPGNQMTLVGGFSEPSAWVLSNQTITPSGKVFRGPAGPACLGNSTPNGCSNWINSLHLRQSVSYQPASRFWPLQFIETGIYLVLAVGLGWLCVWRVRRRRV
jgi:hypothetical protein